MLKGKKKALAAQVLLGLMVAGNAYAADITVTGEGAEGSWGDAPYLQEGTEYTLLAPSYCYVQDGNNPLLGEGGVLFKDQASIEGHNITIKANIQGTCGPIIKAKKVVNNVITFGEGDVKEWNLFDGDNAKNIFDGLEVSKDNTLKLGILKSTSTVKNVNVGTENDIVLLGGSAVDYSVDDKPTVVANYSDMSFTGRNLTLEDAEGTEKIKSADMKGDITAARHLTAETLTAGGDIVANNGLTVTGDIKGANISTGSSSLKGADISAVGYIASGDITANNLYANDITASGAINVAGVINALNGKNRAAAGDVAGNSIKAGSIIAHDVIASSGDIVADSINATGNVTATSGSVTLNNGASSVGGTLKADNLNLAGNSSLNVNSLQTDNICITSTAKGTVLTAGNITKADGVTSAKLDDVFMATQSTTSTALFDTTYGTYVDGSAIKSGLVKSEIREQSKSYVETQMAALAMVASGADLLANAGFTNAAQAVQDAKDSGESGRSMVPYAAANYGSMRQESGSHVDVKGSNFNIGFAKEVKNGSGKLLFGPMIEYGRGNYDSYLDDGTTGSGTAQNYGIGMMARQTNDNGFYYEGSVRYGKVTSDYSSSNVLAGKDVSYDNSAKYWGAHVGVGKLQKLGGDNAIDLYGKLFYTNQGSSSVNIDGDTLDFSSVKSKRSRIGFRYIHGTSKVRSVYAGLAWQYEFDGAAHATANGFSTPSPSVKGSSGMLELGVLIAPKASPVSFDLGVSGWAGKQKGYSLNANMCWSF